jgi:ribonucleotide reductase alpha subunit
MVADLKYFDGSLAKIDRIPQDLRDIYATAFEVSPSWLVEAASRRQKWIDQAQSLNIYMAGASGKKLDETYKLAWLRGLKTTYYLRTMAATHVEKSTSRTGAERRGSRWRLSASAVPGGGRAAAAAPWRPWWPRQRTTPMANLLPASGRRRFRGMRSLPVKTCCAALSGPVLLTAKAAPLLDPNPGCSRRFKFSVSPELLG